MNLARVVCGQKALLTQGRDRITHLDEGRGLGQLHAGRLRGEGDGAGGARICLDDVEGVGEQRELNVDEASHADSPRDRLGRGGDALQLTCRQRHGRQHAGRVTRVDARLLDVLHDGAHEELLAVVQGVHVDLDGGVEEAVDEKRAAREEQLGVVAGEVLAQRRLVVDDRHATPAQHEGGANEDRVSDLLGDGNDLLGRVRRVVCGRRAMGRLENLAELLAVLGQVDGPRARAQDRHAGALEVGGERQRGLAAELDDHALDGAGRALGAVDFQHVLEGQGLEVESVRDVVVGRDRLGVAVDHDGLVAAAQRHGGVHARVVELDALADAVGAGSQDDDGLALARAHLVLLVVGRVVVGRAGGELGGARVDRLEDGVDAERAAHLAHRVLRQASHGGDLAVGEAVTLRLGQDVTREGLGSSDAGRDLVEEEHLVQEPRVDLRGLVELLEGRAAADRLLDLDEAPLGANRSGLDERVGLLGGGCRPVPVELHAALVDRAQRLLEGLRVGTTDRHGLADGLHRGGEGGVGGRELFEGETRDLHDHVVERRLKRGRGRSRDVVGDLVQRVAGGKARGDLRDREARRLRGQGGGTRHARVHLDDDDAARLGVDRELDVTAARVHAHGADDGDADVAQALHLAVGEG